MADLELDGVNSKAKINKIESDTGSTVTLGQSGDTVTLGSGATLGSVFDPTQTVDWSSTIITSDTTLASGNGYFVDTTSGAITVTLPASPSVGDYLQIKDYAGTFGTNNLTIARNGSNIQGSANNSTIETNRASIKLIYADSTKGWLYVEESNVGDLKIAFVAATGGTITTTGDFKIHTFTSSGTFTVSDAGNSSGSNTVDYLVIAGGGGAGAYGAGGGGAGGYRFSNGTASGSYSAGPSPLGASALPVSAQAYPITVGGGGAGGDDSPAVSGSPGSNSVFSTITSAGGGKGAGGTNPRPAGSGGSGGGGDRDNTAGGSGNTPSVSPSQGNNGGTGIFAAPNYGGGGGGGASAVGGNGSSSTAGNGGDGLASSITDSSVTRGGGGGGGTFSSASGGTGGSGGGGSQAPDNGGAGTANTGGGGGSNVFTGGVAGAGGSGIVVIRYKFQ
jgi:hypothetical protein